MWEFIENFWLYYDICAAIITVISILSLLRTYKREDWIDVGRDWLKIGAIVLVMVSIGSAILISYMHFFWRPAQREHRTLTVARLEKIMELNEAIPYYRMISKYSPKSFSELHLEITLKSNEMNQMSDFDRAIFLHQQSLGHAKRFFCSASDAAMFGLINRHRELIEELQQRNYDLLLKFQYPQIFQLLQPEDVTQVASFGPYLQALEAVIESGAKMEQKCAPGEGIEISKKFTNSLAKKEPEYMTLLSNVHADLTAEARVRLATGIVLYYTEALKLPKSESIQLWRRLIERN